jgi:hypothetical protein
VEVPNTKRNLLEAIEFLRIQLLSSTAAYTTTGNARHITHKALSGLEKEGLSKYNLKPTIYILELRLP